MHVGVVHVVQIGAGSRTEVMAIVVSDGHAMFQWLVTVGAQTGIVAHPDPGRDIQTIVFAATEHSLIINLDAAFVPVLSTCRCNDLLAVGFIGIRC